MKVNLRKAWGEDEMPLTIKIQYPLRNKPCNEGRRARKVIILTRGRPVEKPKTCNYDSDLLSTVAIQMLRIKGFQIHS
jgi:hypothetical protein